jgi:sugar phosphate isomerase/epimerase
MSFKLALLTYNMARHWDLATLLAKAKGLGFAGVELRTDQGHAHGVELALTKPERAKVRAQVEASGVALCGLSSGCKYDAPEEAELRRHVDQTKALIGLSADVGAPGLKVFGNNFHEDRGISRDVTMAQVGDALKECAQFARPLGVELRFEMHADFNPWKYAVRVVELTDEPNVSLIYNCDARDLVAGSLADTWSHIAPYVRHVHLHDLTDEFPYRELFRLLTQSQYTGYTSAELPDSTDPERVLRYYHALWEAYVGETG